MFRKLILICGAIGFSAVAVGQAPKPVAPAKSPPAQVAPRPAPQPAPPPLYRTVFLVEMDAQFRKMDADKNGLLTRIEIEQFQKLAAIAEAEARNRGMFVQLDADRNGQLSLAEFRKLTSPPSPANATPMLSRQDSNKDQQISLVEHRSATLANFDRLDVDKDGAVTAAEMKAGGIAPQ